MTLREILAAKEKIDSPPGGINPVACKTDERFVIGCVRPDVGRETD